MWPPRWTSAKSKFKGSTAVSRARAALGWRGGEGDSGLESLLTGSLAFSAEVAVGQEQAFSVNTRGAGGQGQLDVRMTSPSRRPIPCKLEPGGGADAQAVRYMPPEEGPYKVDITYDGHPVPGSPFAVEGVLPPDPSKVRKWGLLGACGEDG